jgi:alkylated DNA repair dioxygenase AlkB
LPTSRWGGTIEHVYDEQTFVAQAPRSALNIFGQRTPEADGAVSVDWQASLFAGGEPGFDRQFRAVTRLWLDATSWIDHLPRWVDGSDTVFAELVARLPWQQRTVPMYDRLVREPRLVWWWSEGAGELPLGVLDQMRQAVSERYDRWFDSCGCNYYRTGADSVAWHGDRVRLAQEDPIVVIVSVGAPRPFLVRPRGGGHSMSFLLGQGDLFVMGGAAQHDWEHTVPKVASAGPRISITYRHGVDAPPPEVGRPPQPGHPSTVAQKRHTPTTRLPHGAGTLQVRGAAARGTRPYAAEPETEGHRV